MADARRTLEMAAELVRRAPGAVDRLERFVSTMQRGLDRYKGTHWGDEGPRDERIFEGDFPDLSEGVVEMGKLLRVDYETRKGRGRPVEIFYHEFEWEPLPILGFSLRDNSLVIIRNRSRYTVTNHGIEG